MAFIHLHVHSEYSLLSGVASVSQLVARAKALGMNALALTDTNRMSALIAFYLECRKQGIQPILGVELSEAGNKAGNGLPGEAHKPDENIVLLAKNAKGYGDLCELVTMRQLQGGKFTFAEAFKREWPDLVFLTTFPRYLRLLAQGPNRAGLYGELLNSSAETRRRSREVESLCLEQGIPLTVSNDCHFLDPGDFELHRVLRAIDLNSTLSRLKPHEHASPHAWFKSPSHMEEIFPRHPEARQNTRRIADLCRVDLALGKWIMPEITVPEGHTPDSYLEETARLGLRRNYAGSPALERAEAIQEMELGVIRKLGYSSYFLMVKEIRDWSNATFQSGYRRPKDCTILRGSAANSITFFNLGVSDLDPIEHNLYFQRFLNEDRASPPDADLDFGWDEREKILDRVVERFGRDRVAITCTTNHFRFRAAFREAAKVFGYTEEQISAILDGRESRGLHGVKDVKGDDAEIRAVMAWAARIRGKPRFLGQHPGGILITNDPIWRHVACENSGGEKNRIITQIDMHNGIDELGLIKFDLLGNGSLSVLRDTLAQLEEQGLPDPEVWNLEKCYNDPSVQDIIAKGRTRGIFYIESPAQARLNKKALAGTFPEITITSSLVRPAGTAYAQVFVERHRKSKQGIKDWDFLHPSLESILSETHDVCAFQEDVTKVCHHVAGLSYKTSDRIRKMMNSQHEGDVPIEEMKTLTLEFIEGCRTTRGLSPEQAFTLWERVSSFTGFSFCKSHSASYAQLSFKCTYLKAHYPAQFLAAVISNNHGYYTRGVYLNEARRWGVRILPMHINTSGIKYRGKDGAIRPGLMHVRSLGAQGMRNIVEERGRNGPFADLPDFLERVAIHKHEIENLILSGSFDGLGMTQPELLYLLDASHGGTKSSQPGLGLPGLWAEAERHHSYKAHPGLGDYSLMQKCLNERYLLGYMLSGDMLDILELHPAAKDAVTAAEVSRHVGRRIKILGMKVTERLHFVARSGKPMEFLTLEDKTECVDVVFWPAVLERFADTLREEGPFEVWGKVTKDWDTHCVEADFVRLLAWSPNQVDFELASRKLEVSSRKYSTYADIESSRAA